MRNSGGSSSKAESSSAKVDVSSSEWKPSLTASKVGSVNNSDIYSIDFSSAGGAYKTKSKKYGVLSLDGKHDTGAKYYYAKSAKKESEDIIRGAEERKKAMIEQSEVMREAKAEAAELLNDAKGKASEIRKAANDYVENVMKRTDDAITAQLTELRKTRQNLRITKKQ